MVRATGNINEVSQYNYCVYVNNGKYNFAFITRYQYVNDDMTWIYLQTDPWLNFAGKYTFNDSPMRRCHPLSDDPLTNANYIPEPVHVRFYRADKHTFGVPSQEGIYKVYLLTTVLTTSFTAQSIVDYWDGIADLLQSYNTAKLISWSQGVDSGMTAVIGGNVQPDTSILSLSQAKDIIKLFSQNGQQNYILGAYHIPDYFRDTSDDGPDRQTLTPVSKTESVPSGIPGGIHWRKLLYSPQFHKYFLNVTGNTREIPADKINPYDIVSGNPLILSITANPGVGGSAVVKIQNMVEADMYGVESLTWDSVSLTGFGVSANPLKRNILAQGDTLFNAVGGILSGITGAIGAKGLQKGVGILGDVLGAAEAGAVSFGSEALDMERIVKSGGVAVGTTAQSIGTYNLAFPLIIYESVQPTVQEIERIEKVFGTYGYMQDGQTCPIVFGNYPHWNYYQTVDASIEGNEVPQEYLFDVIRMFNRGVFIFNSIGDYKDFSLAPTNHL